MFSISHGRYFLYGQPTDMRKSFDGLCGLVTSKMQQDPMSGDIFIFINKKRNRIKLLRWEPGGFVLFYKRLEKGTFEFPGKKPASNTHWAIDYSELMMIITGISMKHAKKRPRFYPPQHVEKSYVKDV
mgnify:CR=1 FL=1